MAAEAPSDGLLSGLSAGSLSRKRRYTTRSGLRAVLAFAWLQAVIACKIMGAYDIYILWKQGCLKADLLPRSWLVFTPALRLSTLLGCGDTTGPKPEESLLGRNPNMRVTASTIE